MDHKRDSDHPSKRKCNQYPDCSRPRCWYIHPNQEVSDNALRPTEKKFNCKTCQQDFSDKNELMHHKKREHPSNIMCQYFLSGNCRQSANQGAKCWYRHNLLPITAQNVERVNIPIPPHGRPSWNQNFPPMPTLSQSPVVGLQQQIMAVLQQQRQEQQNQQNQHQQQMSLMMTQMMKMNM